MKTFEISLYKCIDGEWTKKLIISKFSGDLETGITRAEKSTELQGRQYKFPWAVMYDFA